jgi:hypothetical protein
VSKEKAEERTRGDRVDEKRKVKKRGSIIDVC